MKITIDIEPVTDVREFITELNTRRIGQLYFCKIAGSTKPMVPRVISAETDGNWLKRMIQEGKIFKPAEVVVCEKG